MAVKIKLKRLGKIHAPYYRIVVADARTKRDGRAIEEIGKYHPMAEPSFIEVESERAQYWLSVGAQPTDPVRRIFEITGDWQKFRGEPGAEGTLRTAEPKAAKSERFAEAVSEHRGTATETAPKGKTRGKSASGKSASGKSASGKSASGKADSGKADSGKADSGKADSGKAEGKADTAKADTKKKPAGRAAKAASTQAADETAPAAGGAPAEAAAEGEAAGSGSGG